MWIKINLQLRKTPLVVVPLLAGVVSTILFFAQGGFGGGHGSFDGIIVTLMLPSVFAAEAIPLPQWILYFDLTYTVIIPTLMNTALVWLAYQLVGKLRGRHT